MNPKIHKLASGATVISLSPGHGFRFNDGTQAEGQDREICDLFKAERLFEKVAEIAGMTVNRTVFSLSNSQLDALRQLAGQADIVVAPFLVVDILHRQGVRDQFPNVVAFNATAETQRSAPADKVVDINNWSF